jgi:hypothetical protein
VKHKQTGGRSSDSTLRLRKTLRGIVYSIRPSVARSVGLVTSLDDLLTVDGVSAWNLGLQVLRNGSTDNSSLGARFLAWTNAELAAEQTRWKTVHVLAESVESRLSVGSLEMNWVSSIANTSAFADRILHGESILTTDVVERFSKITRKLTLLPESDHWQSLDNLLVELDRLVCFPVQALIGEVPSLVSSEFAKDLASWLSVENG